MIISNSSVSMAASSRYSQATKYTSETSSRPVLYTNPSAGFGAWLFNAKSQLEGENDDMKTQEDNNSNPLPSGNYSLQSSGATLDSGDSSTVDLLGKIRFQTIDWILKLLFGEKVKEEEDFSSQLSEIFSQNTQMEVTSRETFEYVECQSMSFSATGTVVTEDGRNIEFGVDVKMSRSFSMTYSNTVKRIQDIRLMDPLVINIGDSDTVNISDQKFFFDLDCDGTQEEINRMGIGSGFLALDKNGDGQINDGSELFGAISGNAFGDLAAYDEDKNGWIDEADEIFKKLKVWSMNDDGSYELMDLKKCDVGAIFLGSVNSGFSLKDRDNNLQAQIAETGIYLRESSGRAGTMAHVDMVG